MAKQKYMASTNNATGIETASAFKFAFILMCSALLIYQTVDLVTEYFRYKTIVMVENDISHSAIEFPSVSICEKFPHIGVINGSTSFRYKFPIGTSIKMLKSGRIRKGNNNVIGYVEVNNHRQRMNQTEIKNKHSNLTIRDTFGPFDDHVIKCITFNNGSDCYPSIHSMSALAQCRTYFSQISSSGEVAEKVVRKISRSEVSDTNSFMATFYINFTEDSYEKVLPKGDLFIFVHDSKAFPDDRSLVYASRRFLIKSNKNYDLSFNKKTITRLEKPYKTDCFKYDENVNSNNIYSLSRTLCSLKCKTEATLSKYHCMRFGSEVIYETNYSGSSICNFSIHLDMSDDSIYYYEYLQKLRCLQECKTECVQEIYNYELHEVDRSDGDLINHFINATNVENVTLVTLMVKLLDEISYTDLPKMNFTDLWCGLGGLFSLWLGLSVLAVYDSFIALCVSLTAKTKLFIFNK